ncbi:unnamed protein product [Caretta caretta]
MLEFTLNSRKLQGLMAFLQSFSRIWGDGDGNDWQCFLLLYIELKKSQQAGNCGCPTEAWETPEEAASYHPISLFSAVSKLMEQVLLHHLSDIIEDILPAEQAGFCLKRNCCDHIASLTGHVEEVFQFKLKTGIALVDLSLAYDTVWRQGLLLKISHVIQLPANDPPLGINDGGQPL